MKPFLTLLSVFLIAPLASQAVTTDSQLIVSSVKEGGIINLGTKRKTPNNLFKSSLIRGFKEFPCHKDGLYTVFTEKTMCHIENGLVKAMENTFKANHGYYKCDLQRTSRNQLEVTSCEFVAAIPTYSVERQ